MNSPYGPPAECASCHLRSDNFSCALSHKSLNAFHQVKHAAVFPEGAVIFVEGQSPRGIFMLCQGQAKLSTTSREGKTFILRLADREGGRSPRFARHCYRQAVRGDGRDDAVQPAELCEPRRLPPFPLKRTATLVCTPLSKSAASVRTHTKWFAQSGCPTRSPQGLPNSCSNPRAMHRPGTDEFA